MVGLKAKPTFISLNPLAHFSFLQFSRGHSGRCFFLIWGEAKKIFLGGGGVCTRVILCLVTCKNDEDPSGLYFQKSTVLVHFLNK